MIKYFLFELVPVRMKVPAGTFLPIAAVRRLRPALCVGQPIVSYLEVRTVCLFCLRACLNIGAPFLRLVKMKAKKGESIGEKTGKSAGKVAEV